MTITDTINRLKQEGMPDSQIINTLEEQGISPREINDAIARTAVKQAISENLDEPLGQSPEQVQEIYGNSQMQPSLPTQLNSQIQEEYPSEYGQESEEYSQEYGQTEENYDQNYANQGYDQGYDANYGQEYEQPTQSYAPSSNDTISEIADQIISEKILKVDKNIKNLIEFKSLFTSKVEKIDERLKKIEKIIDVLQMSLIRKSLDQEQNLEDIKNEMKLMQNGFGKFINPLTDTIKELKEKSPKTRKTRSKKKK